MSDWSAPGETNNVVISTISPEAIGAQVMNFNATPASAAWAGGTANFGIHIPFVVYKPMLALKMAAANGITAAGNVDVGIYDDQGNRIVSIGTTAMAGTSSWQIFDIADTVLFPGNYYMSRAHDSATATSFGYPCGVQSAWLGVYQQAGTYPLPATATFAAGASFTIPGLMVTGRLVV